MVGEGQFLPGQLVQAGGSPLGQSAVVDEDQRRPVALNEAVDLGEDQSPNALVREVGKIRRNRDHFDVHLLTSANIDNRDGPGARGVLST